MLVAAMEKRNISRTNDMKTEPTETLSIKRANIVDKYLPPIDEQRYYQRLEMHEELIDLVNSHSPKIKQLEWMDDDFPYRGYSVFVDYIISKNMSSYYTVTLDIGRGIYLNSFKTIEEAKAVAQADFEKRVKECLDYE